MGKFLVNFVHLARRIPFWLLALALGSGLAGCELASSVLQVITAGLGQCTADSGDISCGARCLSAYAIEARVRLTATAAAASIFLGWERGCQGSVPLCELAVLTDTQIRATLARSPAVLASAAHGARL